MHNKYDHPEEIQLWGIVSVHEMMALQNVSQMNALHMTLLRLLLYCRFLQQVQASRPVQAYAQVQLKQKKHPCQYGEYVK